MSILSLLAAQKNWTGNIAEFVSEITVVQEILQQHYDVKPNFFGEPSVRLIRYYSNLGIFHSTVKTEKATIYGFDQIVCYLAVRSLLADDWKLSKISELLAGMNGDETLVLIEESFKGLEKDQKIQNSGDSIADLLATFKREAGLTSEPSSVRSSDALPDKVQSVQTKSIKEPNAYRGTLEKFALTAAKPYRETPPDLGDRVRNVLEYSFTTGLRLSIDQQIWSKTEAGVKIRALDELTAIINSLNR